MMVSNRHLKSAAHSSLVGTTSAVCRIALIVFALATMAACTKPEPWDGDWVMRFRDQNLMVLHLDAGKGTGSLQKPRKITFDNTGFVTDVEGEEVEWPLTIQTSSPDSVQVVARTDEGEDAWELRLGDDANAELVPEDLPDFIAPFAMERPAEDNTLQVGTDWEEHLASPELEALRDQLIAMEEADQTPRQKIPIDYQEMDRVDALHRPEVERIHEAYGWPTYSLVGHEAADAFFLLVQHQDLEMQQAWMPEMEKLVAEGEASPQNLTLLYDRVMLRQGKPQRWGNGAQCVDGKVVVQEPVEDPEHLDERRAEKHLLPMDQYLALMAPQCAAEAAE